MGTCTTIPLHLYYKQVTGELPRSEKEEGLKSDNIYKREAKGIGEQANHTASFLQLFFIQWMEEYIF